MAVFMGHIRRKRPPLKPRKSDRKASPPMPNIVGYLINLTRVAPSGPVE